MVQCSVCGATLAATSGTCVLCGTMMPEPVPGPSGQSHLPTAEVLPPGSRLCPGCGQSYGPDYADTFCTCGLELFRADQLPAAIVEDAPPPGWSDDPSQPSTGQAPARPPAGTRCLVLYGASKEPVNYFPLTKESILIGRLDAVAGNFPDIDVTQWLDAALARKVSRKHALVIRLRSADTFFLRPLAGSTGTQVGADMVEPLMDYPLEPGSRIILGGAVRFRFESGEG
ncbi:MAG TPA: FHA domain-containing protein [Gemmataceae bacterium]|jgi:hypothetical protein|nr:FHA domain-containing protein [Gemmataceae bacterium]